MLFSLFTNRGHLDRARDVDMNNIAVFRTKSFILTQRKESENT